MLETLRLQNFKAFGRRGVEIPLAPLTVLIGANSVGKSSIMQALLALKQSWAPRIDGFTTLRPQGAWTKLGRFGSVQHGQQAVPVGVRLGWERREVGFTWEADHDEGAPKPAFGSLTQLDLLGEFGPGRLRLDSLTEDESGHTSLRFDPSSWDRPLRGEDARTRSLRERLVLPAGIKRGGHPELALRFDSSEHSYSLGIEYPTPEPGSERRAPLEPLERSHPFARRIREAADDVLLGARRKMESIRYIGPSRAGGKRLYALDETGSDHSGLHGERVADVLHRAPILGAMVDRREAVNEMLAEMGVGLRLDVREVWGSAVTIELIVRDERAPSVELTLADVGYGLSQVLPILTELAVMRENARRGDILLVEQPELHLNPRWQKGLVRVIVDGLSLSDRRQGATNQVILETHGRAMVDEIAALVADGELDGACVRAHLVHRDSSGAPHLRHLPIDAGLSRYVCEDY